MLSVDETQPLLASGNQNSHIGGATRGPYTVYGVRWYILGVLVLLNISNGMLWTSFSPIADYTAEYYAIDDTKVNWLSMVFMVVSIPVGLFVVWFLDTIGLRANIVTASWLNAVGAGIRAVSCMNVPHVWQFPLLLGGQTLCGLAQPFVMVAPTKLAALWFPADQRALANTMGTISNAIGIMIGNLVSPVIVKHANDIPKMMYIYAIPAGISVLLATFGVCRSLPPTPPTSGAAEESEPFAHGVKQIIRNKHYWILAAAFGVGVALFTVVCTLMEQLLCPQGYSDRFAGLCSVLMIAVGLVGAGCAAVYADKTKNFVEVAKCGLGLATICLVTFLVLTRYPGKEVLLLIFCSLTGFFGFASNPILLELSVETTFPVAEATSAGVLIMSGQIQSFMAVFGMQMLAQSFSPGEVPHQSCNTAGVMGVDPQDYTVPNMCLSGYGVLIVVLFVLFYRCDYRRMTAEQCRAAESILVNSETLPVSL